MYNDSYKKTQLISKAESWRMFDDICDKYDLLNRILSLGQDIRWRESLSEFLPELDQLTVLDLATGTADVLLTLMKNNPQIIQATGLDLSEKMLNIGRRKVEKKGLTGKILLRHGDAEAIAYPEHSFTVITIAFGIRNVKDPLKSLQEMYRVLERGGRVLILEFSLPTDPLIRFIHLRYLRHIVPMIGKTISGNREAYDYLSNTIESFPYGKKFLNLMNDAGFKDIRARSLLFGTATIYQGDKF